MAPLTCDAALAFAPAGCQHVSADVDDSPLGASPAEAAAFVREQLERSLPPDRYVVGLDQSGYLRGEIRQLGTHPSYDVLISAARDLLIFSWGNSDHGPLTVETALTRALVVTPAVVRMFGMRACVTRLLEFPPNTYGLT